MFSRLSRPDVESRGGTVADIRRRKDVGVGWRGGLLLPIALGGGWSLAPEVRMAFGFTGEHGEYLPVSSGVRLMWGF